MMILVTGGSGSGKSAFAEECVLRLGQGPRIYLATMVPFDEESRKRIERHRRMRKDKGFETVERYTKLGGAPVPKDSVALLECMSNLVANEMFQRDGAGADTVQAVLAGVQAVREKVRHLVIVTNEICSDVSFYEQETRDYLKNLGRINQALAEMADQVVEVVYGIPVFHKGGTQ